ncbi:E3 ubiquitin-protein ligase mind-bomb-like, partial [Physella acuta]|uniref:E3 ubiquitin-protein ligase mind-bomb-like n=1 Tax=Physella acuta TaxID=109671 RepID=UPI0027DE63D5
DTVICNKDAKRLIVLQQGHGGWNDGMAKKGTVQEIDEDGAGDVHVIFDDKQKWRFNPNALDKCKRFDVGDTVICNKDAESMKALQQDHGGWNDGMAKGTVCDVDENENAVVVYEDREKRTFNPLALVKLENKLADMMKDDIVKQVLDLNIPENLVKKTLEKRLAETGEQFESVESLTQAVLQDNCSSDSPSAIQVERQPCTICMDSEAVITFVPCGHLTCCGTCAAVIDNCPICRSPIERRIRTFVA